MKKSELTKLIKQLIKENYPTEGNKENTSMDSNSVLMFAWTKLQDTWQDYEEEILQSNDNALKERLADLMDELAIFIENENDDTISSWPGAGERPNLRR